MYDWNLGLSLKMIYDYELGFNYIFYNEFKILNIKIILYVL